MASGWRSSWDGGGSKRAPLCVSFKLHVPSRCVDLGAADPLTWGENSVSGRMHNLSEIRAAVDQGRLHKNRTQKSRGQRDPDDSIYEAGFSIVVLPPRDLQSDLFKSWRREGKWEKERNIFWTGTCLGLIRILRHGVPFLRGKQSHSYLLQTTLMCLLGSQWGDTYKSGEWCQGNWNSAELS